MNKSELKTTTATIYQLDESGAVTKSVTFESQVVAGVRDNEKQKELQISILLQKVRHYFKLIEDLSKAGMRSTALDWRLPVHVAFTGRQEFDTGSIAAKVSVQALFKPKQHAQNMFKLATLLIEGMKFASQHVDVKMTLADCINIINVELIEDKAKQKAIRAQRQDEQIASIAGLTDEQAMHKMSEDRAQWIERQKQLTRFRNINNAAKQAVSSN